MRNSPPIHTCSEHAQGPSKPPAVVRKLWSECVLFCVCVIAWISSKMAKWKLGNKGWGEGGVGRIWGIKENTFVILWHYGSRIHSSKVTDKALLVSISFGPPSVRGFAHCCSWEHTGLKGKGQRDSGMLNFVLLWFWSEPSTLDTLTCPVVCMSDLLFLMNKHCLLLLVLTVVFTFTGPRILSHFWWFLWLLP